MNYDNSCTKPTWPRGVIYILVTENFRLHAKRHYVQAFFVVITTLIKIHFPIIQLAVQPSRENCRNVPSARARLQLAISIRKHTKVRVLLTQHVRLAGGFRLFTNETKPYWWWGYQSIICVYDCLKMDCRFFLVWPLLSLLCESMIKIFAKLPSSEKGRKTQKQTRQYTINLREAVFNEVLGKK